MHIVIGLTELGLDHKEAIRLAYSMGCDLNDNFTDKMHACFERQNTANFNENGYQLTGFFWNVYYKIRAIKPFSFFFII